MKEAFRQVVAGTAIEPVLRIWWRRLRVGPETGRNAADNRVTTAVMARLLRADSSWVEVGASTGDLLWHVLRYAPRGRHVAFEPIPESAALLRAKLPPNVAVHALAIADHNGEMEFQHVVSNAGYSGLQRRTYPRADEDVRPIRVRVARLDDALPADLRITAMKIDVEGAELQVFQGATRILQSQRPWVLFEHGRGAADCYGTSPEMVYDLLADAAYRISVPADWLAGRPPLDRRAFVACFGTETCNFIASPAEATNGGR